MFFFKKIFVALALLYPLLVDGVASDTDDRCQGWAEMGECEKNPNYMMNNCATSCDNIAKQALEEAKELENIKSFFDLSANDIMGNNVDFSSYRDQVTIIVNVASYCGYTDSHYKGLVDLWSHVKSTSKINILAFPCNQFGSQEPESNESISEFAKRYGVEFTMMEKINVNGPNASLVYKYLKREAGPTNIGWNFATYFVISPDGSVQSHSGIEPMQLKDLSLSLVSSEEL